MKPKYVYHGSGKRIKGNLIPIKASDLDGTKDNILKGVYASDNKNEAIAMGIIRCKGVGSATCGTPRAKSNKIIAIIYEGAPKQTYFYLYTLSSKGFVNRPKGSHEWVSPKLIKPENVEKLKFKDYIKLIRKETKEEKEKWFKEYGDKLK